jgi:hypothetical protein
MDEVERAIDECVRICTDPGSVRLVSLHLFRLGEVSPWTTDEVNEVITAFTCRSSKVWSPQTKLRTIPNGGLHSLSVRTFRRTLERSER